MCVRGEWVLNGVLIGCIRRVVMVSVWLLCVDTGVDTFLRSKITREALPPEVEEDDDEEEEEEATVSL